MFYGSDLPSIPCLAHLLGLHYLISYLLQLSSSYFSRSLPQIDCYLIISAHCCWFFAGCWFQQHFYGLHWPQCLPYRVSKLSGSDADCRRQMHLMHYFTRIGLESLLLCCLSCWLSSQNFDLVCEMDFGYCLIEESSGRFSGGLRSCSYCCYHFYF